MYNSIEHTKASMVAITSCQSIIINHPLYVSPLLVASLTLLQCVSEIRLLIPFVVLSNDNFSLCRYYTMKPKKMKSV